MTHDEWTENVWRITEHGKEEINTCYLVDCGDVAVAIDTGTNEKMGREVIRALDSMGKSPSELSHIILTHAHPELIGGLNYIRKANPEVKILAHENSKPIFEEGKKYVLSKQFPLDSAGGKLTVAWKTPIFENYKNLPKADSIDFISGGEDFQFGDETFIFQHSGGHSSDSIILHTLKSKVTFIGDELGLYNNNEYSFFFDLTGSPDRRSKALRACQRLKTKYILSSHISPIETEYIDEEVESAIQAQQHFETTLRESLLGLDSARLSTLVEHVNSTLNIKWRTPYSELKVHFSTIKQYLEKWKIEEAVLYDEKTKRWRYNREKIDADFDPYSTF